MDNDIVLQLDHGPDNPRNSEGSFVTLADGRVLFAYTRYYGADWADHATAQVCGRFSRDGGQTWSAEDTVLVENEGRQNVMSVSLLRLQDGRIGLWYLRKNSLRDCQAWMRTSADEGQTWSRPRRCIPAPGYFVVNNDRVIQLKSGRLILPAGFHRNRYAVSPRSKHYYASLDGRALILFFLSDDGGKSWRESQDWWAMPVRSSPGLQEPGVVALKDGRLYAWCRTGAGCQYEMVSADDGETWSPPQPSAFLAPASPLSMKRIPRTGDLLAIWNDYSGAVAPAPPGGGDFKRPSWGRTPLVAAVSQDEGRTWGRHLLLESDPDRGFCYVAIHFIDDAVLLGYCCGGGEKGVVLQDTCLRRIDINGLYA